MFANSPQLVFYLSSCHPLVCLSHAASRAKPCKQHGIEQDTRICLYSFFLFWISLSDSPPEDQARGYKVCSSSRPGFLSLSISLHRLFCRYEYIYIPNHSIIRLYLTSLQYTMHSAALFSLFVLFYTLAL